MPNQLKFLDFTGTEYLVNKIKAIDAKIPTSQEINTMISTALETFEQDFFRCLKQCLSHL